jgi:hypothetical protein
MIWLSWRQARTELLIGGGALALLVLFLLWTGLEMTSAYDAAGLETCAAQAAPDDACRQAADGFLGRFRKFDNLTGWLNLLPFLLGLLLAAPTVLDFEHGTYRLAWTQSVTRRRWLATKIGVGLAVAVGVSVALTALWNWWRGPFDAIEGRFGGNGFDFEGVVPVSYLVFAFALCLSFGALTRRTIPSIGLAFVLFLAARLGVLGFLRQRYLEPRRITWDPTEPAPAAAQGDFFGDGDWIFSLDRTDAAGQVLLPGDPTVSSCVMDAESKTGPILDACLQDHGIFNTIVYHPADRFWTFQAIETALFLGLSAGLLALTAYWVTRRIV